MKFICLTALVLTVFSLIGCKEQKEKSGNGLIIGRGQMPDLARDNDNNLYVVYGSGDSILFSFSSNKGKNFSSPALIAVLPELAASHMRGPQIAATTKGITVIASNRAGDIFSFTREGSGQWLPPVKVNDVDSVAKEGLMALHADDQNAFAVWLDLRDKHNKIFGAGSSDGGKTWSKNKLIYASPDTTVCECCKPSVVINGKNVTVMFRNWLNGNRDLYLARSADGGISFDGAQKLGNGSWPLNGCPMDGGNLAVQDNNLVQTVWRRERKIYACEPGKAEKEIGEGRSCTLTMMNSRPVYAWIEKGQVVCLLSESDRKIIGEGQSPAIRSIDKENIACIWENENYIHATVISAMLGGR